MKLKTLKDFEILNVITREVAEIIRLHPCKEYKLGHTDALRDLRQEAIKWIKYLEDNTNLEKSEASAYVQNTLLGMWIKSFFNLKVGDKK